MNVKFFLGSFLLTFIHFSSFFSQSDSTIKSDTIFNLNPVFTSVADLLDNETQSQDVSGLLQSSRDVLPHKQVLILVQHDLDLEDTVLSTLIF